MPQTKLIANFAKTKGKLEQVKLLLNFCKLTQNQHVYEVYSGAGETNEKAKQALLIHDDDNWPIIAVKILVFFLSLQKLQTSVTEIFTYHKGYVDKDPHMLNAEIILNPTKKYKKDQKTGKQVSIGTRQINIPHVDESKLRELDNFSIVHGGVIRFYSFADKKQIKVMALDKAEGDRAINHLLKIVDKKWYLGTSEEHSATGEPPKDRKTPDLQGVTSKISAIDLGDHHGKLYRIFMRKKDK
jgi:hypothetical protein